MNAAVDLADTPPDLLLLGVLTGSLLTLLERRARGEVVSTEQTVLAIGDEITLLRRDGVS